MTDQKIGAQLDDLGLVIDMDEGGRVAEAVVTAITQQGEGAFRHHTPVRVPTPQPRPVPYPVQQRIVTVVEADQVLTDGQMQRVRAWLQANGIDPKFVSTAGAITIHSRAASGKEGGFRIRYTEFCRDKDGQKFMDVGSSNQPLTVQRCVVQNVPLDLDPEVTLP
ncbi:hypothetical protein OG402_41165 [Streptomyces anulatus]|uniref:hypothetical protein n=1 Tax=Streptomyces anulatus TaxID=1892 RepID=UPI00225BC500|nr:hypothetical protein [Streptomyces anulatus]MCX4606840.1 hypothetical protein [Streptomyces anulatus]